MLPQKLEQVLFEVADGVSQNDSGTDALVIVVDQ